ncbi:MAG TPA: response regulator [Bacteroidota bacterium]|nr:response regulator [Bacteroidota bacterium]
MREKPPRKQNTVLFVDDEKLWLDTIRLAIHSASFKIITAEGGEAALKKLQKTKPDLILSDVRMPFMNGFDLFEKVKQDPKLQGIPYVFMSNIDDFDARKTAREIGADDYVEKPFDSDQMKSIVLNLLLRFKR